MPSHRFPFTIDRHGKEAIIAMDCDGLIRCRQLPTNALEHLGRACEKMCSKARKLIKNVNTVPPYPRYVGLLEATAGPCRITLGAHRNQRNEVEQVIAFYEEGDDRTPVFVLVGEQIEQFIEEATADER